MLSGAKRLALLRWLRSTCADDAKLIGVSYEQYRRLLNKCLAELDLGHVGWSPHSPRAGFASDLIVRGCGFDKTRELGRWSSEQSLRT